RGRRRDAVVVSVIDLVNRRARFVAQDRNRSIGDGHRGAVIGERDVRAGAVPAAGLIGEHGSDDGEPNSEAKELTKEGVHDSRPRRSDSEARPGPWPPAVPMPAPGVHSKKMPSSETTPLSPNR